MKTNEILRAQIFEVVKNQISENNPPETGAAYDKLKKLGFDENQIKEMIGQCLADEINKIKGT